MSDPLIPLTIEAPGFLGLNTQNEGSVLPPGWASVLDNFVYDDIGRLASRKGTKQINGTLITNSPTIRASHEYIDASGNKLNIFAADNKIWKEVSGTMTDISGTISTPTADNWQFANFNGWVVGHQASHVPIIMTSTTGSFANSGGTQHNGNMVLSAWGRKWTALANTLYYSDLLIDNFVTGGGSSAGSVDLASFWPNGMDEAVALADFNGFLIVFGKDSLIVYENPDDPTVMAIVEGVDGVGCIARDSVQIVGTEIMFLSNTGIRTLGRTIQEKSMPVSDISKNVRDALLSLVAGETLANIKSVFNSVDGFYLLSLPTAGTTYMFDLKFPNQDATLKVGRWNFAPTAMNYTQGLKLHMAVTAGYLSHYTEYLDERTSVGAGGNNYVVDFEGGWNDFGQEVAYFFKIPKRASLLAAGTPAGAVTFKWAVDYGSSFTERTLQFRSAGPALWGVATYNSTDTYAAFGDFERLKTSLARTGQTIKVGLYATISQFKFSIQRLDILAKIGKIGI